MTHKTWFRSLLWLLASGLLVAASAAAQTRLTLAIECGGQGQVDQPHRVTVTVTNCADNTDTTVTIPVQAQTETSAIADTTARALAKKGVAGASSGETTNPRYENKKHQAEDIIIPAGYKVKSVKIEKKPNNTWECNDGHLQAYIGKEKVSNQDAKQRIALTKSVDRLPLIDADEVFTWLDIEVIAASWSEPTLVLDLYEPPAADGTQVVHTYEHTSPPGTSTADAVKQLGDYLESLGMVVLYASPTHLMVDIAASGLPIVEGYFSAQVTELSPIGSTTDVEYHFDLQ
jgi:hypothetical protein